MKNWLRRISIGLSIALFAVCCGAVLLFNWHAMGWKALTVPTGSMRPAMPPGSLVLVHSVPVSSLRIGDVITYANPDNPRSTITHRIIKTYRLDGRVPAFITKGDANLSADPIPVVGGLVRGKAVWHVPLVGSWLNWSKSWMGIALFVYLPALLIMIDEVRRLSEYWQRTMPYYSAVALARMRKKSSNKKAPAAALPVIAVVVPILIAFPAHALLTSNTVALVNNQLSAANTIGHCYGDVDNDTNITIINTNNQSAGSGNSTNSNNTTSGNTTSGNASNSNSTSINVTINNC